MPTAGQNQTNKIKTYLSGVFASNTKNNIM